MEYNLSYFTFLAEIKVPGANWILGNVGYMGFYRTNYDEEIWKKLVEQLHRNHKVCANHEFN